MRKRFANVTQRQAVSMVSLNPREETASSTKLEPIITRNQNLHANSTLESILKSPTENIKARLSSAEKRNVDQMSVSLEKISFKQDEESETQDDDEDDDDVNKNRTVVGGRETKKRIDEDEVLGGYYKEVVSSVDRCNSTIGSHKATLVHAKQETDELIKKLDETDRITTQLKNTNFVADNADELVHEILKEEYIFQRHNNNKKTTAEEFLVNVTDTNGNENKKEPKVTLEDKRKLLEALRAIDNGESVDVPITDGASRKSKLMRELFGKTDN